jgi:hypothetical protein
MEDAKVQQTLKRFISSARPALARLAELLEPPQA